MPPVWGEGERVKIGLIDIDSKIPNLALMKISAWHKTQGRAKEDYVVR